LAAALPLWSAAQSQFESRFGKEAAAELRAQLLRIARDPNVLEPDGATAAE
jgi:hypothetical protein